MGHGGYSSATRSFRASNVHNAKVTAEDVDLAKAALADNGFSFTMAADGNLLVGMADRASMARLENAMDGIASVYAMDDRASGYSHRPAHEVFSQRQINNAMNPFGVQVRESRDSAEHPESIAVMLGLDVTGSMGSVPHFLVKEGLPALMDKIIKGGVPHPQVLFMGIGDHECDAAPLQVGQFESSDELLDKWLTDLWLEGRGGSNDGESYLLAWYFAARHTAADCWEKRGRKGYCITIGDEPTLPSVPASFLKRLMGDGQYEDFTALELISKASERWHVHHINVRETASGGRSKVMEGWQQLLADNFHVADRRTDVADIVSRIVLEGEKAAAVATGQPVSPARPTPPPEEMIL